MESDARFWFGDLYTPATTDQWEVIRKLLQQTDYSKAITRLPCEDDTTLEHIEQCYNGYGRYRFQHTINVIQDIVGRRRPTSNTNVAFPVLMVDSIGEKGGGLITYNRLVSHRRHLLWPLPYHMSQARVGFDDPFAWESKDLRVVFRGACSSPYQSKPDKSSRYEIVRDHHHHSWADLGLLHPELHGNRPNVIELVKDTLTQKEQMKNKLILCIEGADISSSFGWVLSSNSLPIHPYPFKHEVWYFGGIEPWVHFIPIRVNGSDLPAIVDWCQMNDAKCKEIAQEGKKYMTSMFARLESVKTHAANLWNLPKN